MKPLPPAIRKPRPSLNSGDQMTQVEFHRRYQTCAEDEKFELIGGVVYMASPMKGPHGAFHVELSLVFGLYKAGTPGVEAADNITVVLGANSEPQPDLLLRILREYGGQSDYNDDDYLVGAPELIAEIAHSTVAIDMNRKRQDYLAAGVQEYIVFCIEEQELHWFHFPSKRKLKPDKTGLFRSRVFPGLWLHGPALVARDSARLVASVQEGLASPEHSAFVRQLEQKHKP